MYLEVIKLLYSIHFVSRCYMYMYITLANSIPFLRRKPIVRYSKIHTYLFRCFNVADPNNGVLSDSDVNCKTSLPKIGESLRSNSDVYVLT